MRVWILPAILAALVVGGPIVYQRAKHTEYRNFRVVDPGAMYRSGQMTPAGFARVAREFGIRTVVSLRDTKDDTGVLEDQPEADYCAAHGLAFYRLPPADWEPVNGVVPGDANVREWMRILADPATERPILVHCFAGIHRTGAHVATYRIAYDGWTPAEAIAEMKTKGNSRTTFADNLLLYLGNYAPPTARP